MNNLFKKLIHDNDELIIALFHLNYSNYSISKLNHNSRIIIKKKPIFHLIYYMNFLEDLLKNLFDNNDEISYLISERKKSTKSITFLSKQQYISTALAPLFRCVKPCLTIT